MYIVAIDGPHDSSRTNKLIVLKICPLGSRDQVVENVLARSLARAPVRVYIYIYIRDKFDE